MECGRGEGREGSFRVTTCELFYSVLTCNIQISINIVRSYVLSCNIQICINIVRSHVLSCNIQISIIIVRSHVLSCYI